MTKVPGAPIAELTAWLRASGFGEYATSFVDNRIDTNILRQLTDDDLKALGVGALGDRKRLLAAIAELGSSSPALTTPDEAHGPLDYTPRPG